MKSFVWCPDILFVHFCSFTNIVSFSRRDFQPLFENEPFNRHFKNDFYHLLRVLSQSSLRMDAIDLLLISSRFCPGCFCCWVLNIGHASRSSIFLKRQELLLFLVFMFGDQNFQSVIKHFRCMSMMFELPCSLACPAYWCNRSVSGSHSWFDALFHVDEKWIKQLQFPIRHRPLTLPRIIRYGGQWDQLWKSRIRSATGSRESHNTLRRAICYHYSCSLLVLENRVEVFRWYIIHIPATGQSRVLIPTPSETLNVLNHTTCCMNLSESPLYYFHNVRSNWGYYR
jgi:hypothetical protein